MSTWLDGVRAKLDCRATTIEFTQTVLGTRPQEFCLICILLEAVCRHPVIDICDTVFKFPNSSRIIISTTTLIQLRIVGKSVIVDAVLISLLFEISSVHDEQPRAEYRTLWHRARDVNSIRRTTVINDFKYSVTYIRLEPLQHNATQAELALKETEGGYVPFISGLQQLVTAVSVL